MNRFIVLIAAILFISCKSTTYFVVRHAERDNTAMTSDVPLSEAGKQRADALKEELKNKKIGTIYSTNYVRTKTTAQPLADLLKTTIQVYDPRDTTFINRIKNVGTSDHEGNMLIIGHSNTVDDIVNSLMGRSVITGDLPDTQYGDLFIVRKKGNRFTFEKKRFGP